jgi:hypothetical protein
MQCETLKARLPWQLKIPLKLVLSSLPVPFSAWRRLGLFRHGDMTHAGYALQVFRRCYAPVDGTLAGLTVLELGPGDSIAGGLLAHAAGAGHSYLVDAAPYASRDIRLYRRMIGQWARAGVPIDHLLGCESFEALCALANITYLTEGLSSLKELSSGCVDYAISNAVLEHVPRVEFLETMTELRRVLTNQACSYHQIDLRDHLAGALHSLRFPDRLWECAWFARSGFYTNRLRYGDLLSLFAAAGFEVAVTAVCRWPVLPTPRSKMRPGFRTRSDDDLLVSGFDVVLRPGTRQT